MLLNYLKLSLRRMARNPFFTFINVVGLSVGFSVFFILWQYSQSELKSDQQWKDWKRIVRIGYTWSWTDNGADYDQSTFGIFYPSQAKQIAGDFGEVTEFTRIFKQDNFSPEFIKAHGKEITLTYQLPEQEPVRFKEFHVAYADPNFFEFFGIPLNSGNPNAVLNTSGSMVISEKTASRYFRKDDPIGKIILLNNHLPFQVTGVFKDLPANTHFDFEVVISSVTLGNDIERIIPSLGGCHTYFKLREDVEQASFEKKLQDADSKYWEVYLNMECKTCKVQSILQPLSSIPFEILRSDYFKSKSKFILIAFKVISLVVLIMGWINYINLSISQNNRRWKEISARLTVGARITDLIIQFCMESVVINIAALLIALTIIQLIASPLNSLMDFHFNLINSISLDTGLIFGLIFLLSIVTCGIIPGGLILNRSRALIKKTVRPNVNQEYFQPLTILQLGVAIVLIVWVYTTYDQMKFILQKDLGFRRDNVLLIDLPIEREKTFNTSLSSFQIELKRIKGVESTTEFTTITGDSEENASSMRCLHAMESKNFACVDTNGGVDENFIPMFGVPLLAGRNFLPSNALDSSSIIVSLAALKRLGISSPEEAISKQVMINAGDWASDELKKVSIIGVIKDFAQRSLHKNVQMGFNNGEAGILLTYKTTVIPSSIPNKIAIRVANYHAVNEQIAKLYKSTFPSGIYNSYFLDNHINRHYNNEKTDRNQLFLFTSIAIGIACLGLLGMISNKVVEKTKEIGIRKVMGAELHQIAQILLNTTVKQIVIATIIGIPVAYYLTQQYLQKYSERITLHWWHFILPIAMMIVIMFLTISSVLWKAAKNNPVEALKYE